MAAYANPIRPARRIKAMALAGAAAAGCTCKAEVELRRWYSDHVQEMVVRHDESGPARHAPSRIGIGRAP